MKKILLLSILNFIVVVLHANSNLKEHEKWWELECRKKNQFEQFAKWIGDEGEPSRIAAREYIKTKKYTSILDIPCGLCVDYDGLRKINPDISYVGIDITPFFVRRAQDLNIPVIEGKIQAIPYADNSFEITYSRHILEHLDSYESALMELIRIAAKEVLVVFFIKPHQKESDIIVNDLIDGHQIYHNRYSKLKLESFLETVPTIKQIFWEDVPNTNETILHILLYS